MKDVTLVLFYICKSAYVKKILKQILKKLDVTVWTTFIWLGSACEYGCGSSWSI